jgi:hypothetical protein
VHPLLDFAIRLGAIAISGSVVLLGRAIDAGLRAQLIGIRAWAEIHKQLSQHPASPIASKTSPPDSEQPGPGVADPPPRFEFIGVSRSPEGHVSASFWDRRLKFLMMRHFDTVSLELVGLPEAVPASVREEALGHCLAFVAKERGAYA